MKVEPIVQKGEDKRLLRLLPCPLKETTRGNLPEGIDHYLELEETLGDDEELRPVEGWLTETGLYKALGKGDLSGIEIIKKSDICREEPRLGIGIQLGTKAAEEGDSYQVSMIRMN